jgi:nitric oxide reductase subunit B
MKQSIRTNAIETRGLLISKRWVQAVAIVMLFSFFVLGLLAYRTYTDQAPIPGKVVRPDGQVLFTRADIIAGQEIFLRNGLMEYGSIFGHGAYLGPDFTADYLVHIRNSLSRDRTDVIDYLKKRMGWPGASYRRSFGY